MKIVTWNWHMDLRSNKNSATKVAYLLKQKPDVAVIPEASEADMNLFDTTSYSHQWIGIGEEKRYGLGMLVKRPFKLSERKHHGNLIASANVMLDGKRAFTLIAVWPVAKGYSGYTKEIMNAFKSDGMLWPADNKVIVAGDFNSHVQWNDKCPKTCNHTSIVNFLRDKGLVSGYHKHHNLEQGSEEHKTHFHNNGETYHLDYIFIPEKWSKGIVASVSSREELNKLSDHAPLSVTIKDF